MNAEDLTAALGGKWYSANQYGKARCPAHDDRRPSLSISERSGKLLVHCHTGCAQEAVVDALKADGLWPETPVLELRPAAPKQTNGVAKVGPGRVVATYDYRDEQEHLLFQTVRYEPKTFRQRRPDGHGGWIHNLTGVRLVLYRLPELLAAPADQRVYLVEGEKDVDRLTALGLLATSNPLGAGKWRAEYNEWLRARHCVVVPDNDVAGSEHAGQLHRALLPLAASVRILALPGLSDKGDLSDWLDAGGTREQLETLADATEPIPPPEPRYPLQTIAELIEHREDRGAQLVEGLVWAGRVTWAFSDPNTGKTLFLLAALMHLAAGRSFCDRVVTPGAVLVIEEDSPLSVVAEYVELLADIYEVDLATLPIWFNRLQGLRITDDEGLAIAREAVAACPQRPSVVLLDACERIVPSDKFNTKELDPFTRFLQGLTTEGVAPVVIDHTNRARTEKGKEVKPIERLFGARAKSAISDIMLYFDGRLQDGPVQVQFAKFRGESPSGFRLVFSPDTGFTLTDRPISPQSPTEQKVMRFFQGHPGVWLTRFDVERVVDVKERTLRRTLSGLAQRRWLIRLGNDQNPEYQLNPKLPPAFE